LVVDRLIRISLSPMDALQQASKIFFMALLACLMLKAAGGKQMFCA